MRQPRNAKANKKTGKKKTKKAASSSATSRRRRDGESLKHVFDLSSDWYWEQDENLRFTHFSGRGLAEAKIDTTELIGKTRWEISGMVFDAKTRADLQAKFDAHEPYELEYQRVQPDGSVHHLVTSGVPMFDDDGRFTGYRGIARDITERKRGEQLLALEHAVNRRVAEATSIVDGIKASIRAVCETEGWACGRYFHVDQRAGVLRFAEAWNVPDESLDSFVARSRDVTYKPSEGLIGRVWQTEQPIWSADIAKDPRIRAGVARKIGMHGAFLFPVMSEGKAIGVLAFHSRQVREAEQRLIQAIGVIGSQIGQFVQRKYAEEVLRENEARFRSLTQISSDNYWEQDEQYRFTEFGGLGSDRHTAKNHSFIGKRRWEQEYFNMTADDWARHIATLDARQPFHDLELCRLDGTGQKVWVSVSGAPKFDNKGCFIGYRGVGKDITERKREERVRDLEHAVTRSLSEAASASEALKETMRAVCETFGWECGRYFRRDEAGDLFRFAESWYVPTPELDRYVAYSREKTFAPGVGIVGRAGAGEPQWVADVSQDARVVYEAMASDHGVRGAFMFPVKSGRTTLGVLSFTSREIREPDARLLQAVRVIGSQIGQFVSRKLAEKAGLRLGRMFAALSATNDAILHAESREDLFQRVCEAAVESGKFSNTTIMMSEAGSSQLTAAASVGEIREFVQKSVVSSDEAVKEGQGLVGTAFRAQRPCISNDYLNDERTRPWRHVARDKSCRSAAALPLILGKRSVGALLIHDKEVNSFDDEITKLLERMAANVSYAIENFEHEAERRQAQERIEYLATHDGLTDLPNRVLFSQLLNLTINSANRFKRRFAVLFLDLDRFKIINDTLGHEAGDLLLQEMATRIKDSLRASDVVARLGGDEFVVLLQEVTAPEQVSTVARKLLSTVIKPVMILGHECRVTASIGISMFPADARDEQSLMKNADMAMYLAKEEGKNNFQFYPKDFQSRSIERLTLETSLRHALEREEFYLDYQAKLDLAADAISGVEALLRWRHPDLGIVSPAQFIPLAEETGLIVPIGKWVLRTACAQNVAWQRAGLPPVCMAVNLSPRQFSDEHLLEDIAATLKETDMVPELLELEITESMVMGNVERASKQLTAIKKMGVRLAIDDFGTGYSSLAEIKRFPIDTIKVDRSFVRELPQDAEDKAITQAIIALGKSLGLTVIAEGVETEQQQTFLHENSCNQIQGFYFSKPVAPEKFAELLRTHVSHAKKLRRA